MYAISYSSFKSSIFVHIDESCKSCMIYACMETFSFVKSNKPFSYIVTVLLGKTKGSRHREEQTIHAYVITKQVENPYFTGFRFLFSPLPFLNLQSLHWRILYSYHRKRFKCKKIVCIIKK